MATDTHPTISPRSDILRDDLTLEQFAANLQDVVTDQGPESYRDAKRFFATSHPSHGMRMLLDEALGRVTGSKPNAPSIIRLDTSLGGGKTHALIALYHAGKGRLPTEHAAEFMNPALVPRTPVERIAVFVGDDAGATSFSKVDGVIPNTLWGFLALCLGGRDAYQHIKKDDDSKTAPGAIDLEQVIGDEPAIIMIDEIARYLTVAAGITVGNSDLAKQTTAFVMSLIKAVEAKPRSVLVVTTTEVTNVFGEETQAMLDALKGIREVLARKEHVLRPTTDSDLAAILSRRLFEPIRPVVASTTASVYGTMVSNASAAGCALPEHMLDAAWAKEVERNYPFHPSLIHVLDKRLSTIPNFNLTRGALRLLALAIRDLWRRSPQGVDLIHLHHLNLADPQIVEEVTSRIQRPALKPVIEVDIVSQPGGAPAHAEQIDAKRGGRYAQYLATSVYYWSLTRETPGVPESHLMGSVLAPGDDHNLYLRAVEDLTNNIEEGAWYLSIDPRGGYRFGTDASPIKVLREIEEAIKPNAISNKATEILENLYRDGGGFKVRRVWAGAQVPDNYKDASMVIFHWDDFVPESGADPNEPAPSKITEIWTKTPSGGIRQFLNRLVFLAPDRNQHARMIASVRRHIALAQLAGSAEHVERFSVEQQKDILDQAKRSDLEARIAVATHMNLLYVPDNEGLELVQMDPPSEADVRKNQTDLLVDRLKAMDKVIVAGSSVPDPTYIKKKLGKFLDEQQPTTSLIEKFASRTDFKLVLDDERIHAMISNGIRTGAWEYYDSRAGDKGWSTKERPGANVVISSQTYVCPIGSAPEEAPAACPICGTIHGPTDCPALRGRKAPSGGGLTLKESGSAGAAFAKVLGKARDSGVEGIKSIEVALDILDGAIAGTEMSRLLTVAPNNAADVSVRYQIEAHIDLKGEGDTASVVFDAVSDDFAVLKDVIRNLLTRPDNRSATLRARLAATFLPSKALDSATIQQMSKAATDTGPHTCEIVLTSEDGHEAQG